MPVVMAQLLVLLRRHFQLERHHLPGIWIAVVKVEGSRKKFLPSESTPVEVFFHDYVELVGGVLAHGYVMPGMDGKLLSVDSL